MRRSDWGEGKGRADDDDEEEDEETRSALDVDVRVSCVVAVVWCMVLSLSPLARDQRPETWDRVSRRGRGEERRVRGGRAEERNRRRREGGREA